MKKKRIVTAMMALSLLVTAEAAPAYPVERTLVLHDGSIVEHAVLMGDEEWHYWAAPDGRQLVEQADGRYVPISVSEGERAPRLASGHAAVDRSKTVHPAPRGLVILVNFRDVRFREENTVMAMDSMLNADGYAYNGAYGSARAYFRDQSQGAYVPQFDVVGPVEMPEDASYYGTNALGGQDRYVGEMTLEACRQVAQLPEFHFADYDHDEDGVIDLVYLIYAGNGEADGGASSTIWPAKWDMITAIQSGNTLLDTDAWMDTTLYSFGGKKVRDFAYSPECVSGSMRRSGIGTFCHEFSHVLGLRDLYDVYYGENKQRNRTPGAWTLMDQGLYNKGGNLPPNMAVHDKYFLGWATPQLLAEPTNVTMPADGQTYYYLTGDGQAALPTDTQTVYYVENRQLTGWDAGLPGHGMLVWKVRYDSVKWADNEVNAEPAVLNYTLHSATGWTGGLGGAYDAYPGTKAVTSCIPVPDYPIIDIEESGGVVRFAVSGGTGLPTMDAIPNDAVRAIHMVTGQRVAESWDQLPSGLYLISYETDGVINVLKRIK